MAKITQIDTGYGNARLRKDVLDAARAEAKRTSRTIGATLDLALRKVFKLPRPDEDAA